MLNYELALQFATKKHQGQFRVGGVPYITHPVAVAEYLKNKNFPIEYQIAGLFHDLLEDTDTTYDEIEKITNTEIAKSVKLLTKESGYDMKQYIERIKDNEMARMVKLADRIHNLSEAHLASKEFQCKYIKETEEWFIDLAKGTVFEEDLNKVLQSLKKIQN